VRKLLGLLVAAAFGAPATFAQSARTLPRGYDQSMPAPGPYEAKLESLLAAQEIDEALDQIAEGTGLKRLGNYGDERHRMK
jgi:hypothetical protein